MTPDTAVPEADDDAGLRALLAHSLLGPLGVIEGFAQMLRERDELTTAERDHYLNRLVANAELVVGLLGDLARGLPPDIVRSLNAHLSRAAKRR